MREAAIRLQAKIVWQTLTLIFGIRRPKPIPKIHFFLSPESKGSLRHRSSEEIDLVHHQQRHGEAITLFHPPEAWVTKLDQIPEEAAHLFAILHQGRGSIQAPRNLKDEFEWMKSHEAFAYFTRALSLQPKECLNEKFSRVKSKIIRSKVSFWKAAHQEGYSLGQKMARAYFEERLDLKALRKWFRSDWRKEFRSKALA